MQSQVDMTPNTIHEHMEQDKTQTLTTIDHAGRPIVVVTLDADAILRYWAHDDAAHRARIHAGIRELAAAITNDGQFTQTPASRSAE